MNFAGSFPTTRMRRNRLNAWTRALTAENRLTPADLIWPIFLTEGENKVVPVESMPGIVRVSVDRAAEHVAEAVALGIPAVALFPYTPIENRDDEGTGALDSNNLMCRGARALKAAHPDLGLIGDVALDTYTSHGHDGVLRDGYVHNEDTVEILIRQAVLMAEAGVDVIAPSDMMDGRIGSIRAALDAQGLIHTRIMSYAAKYASGYYAPFRDAVGSTGALIGDKKTYQMDPGNVREALREYEQDVLEGADMVMVKPAGPYLDVIRRLADVSTVPVAAYQVSGEYLMIAAASRAGWLDERAVAIETLTGIKRAGADIVLTYYADRVAEWLQATS